MPHISVLMPCYNAAATLDEALDSLAAQTFSDFEIVAVDDGSRDETLAVLARRLQVEPRLRLVSLPHRGIIAALNAGLAACQGELVARMDADDRCHPQRLAKQAAYLAGQPGVALVGCQVQAFPAQAIRQGLRNYLEWQNGLLSDADMRRELYVESPLAHPSVMLRRAWLERVGGYEEHGWAEDYDLWLRLAQAGARFAKLDEILLEWRDHPQRLTRTDSRYALENFLRAKAHYLAQGPLRGRDAVIIWGSGMAGRRLGHQLLHHGAPLAAFLDIDPRKIGRTRHTRPIYDARQLPELWAQYRAPIVLVAVGSRGSRQIIRRRLQGWGFVEGQDWWAAA